MYRNFNKFWLLISSAMLTIVAMFFAIGIMFTFFASNAIADEINPQTNAQPKIDKDELNRKINNILNKKVYLKVESPEEYINNLDTTDFVKGLLLESVALSDSIAVNKDNSQKLSSIAQDVINNTACQQAIMGQEAMFHYQKLMNLLFKTPESKVNFMEGQKNLQKVASNISFDKEFIEYCKTQKY